MCITAGQHHNGVFETVDIAPTENNVCYNKTTIHGEAESHYLDSRLENNVE